MTQLLNLPLVDGNKFIVLDEGVDAAYARNLLLAWLHTLRKKGVEHPINILLFSSPKFKLEKCLKDLKIKSYQIKNYFSINQPNIANNIYENITNFVTENRNSIFIIDCLSTLILDIGIAKACRFIEKLFQTHKLEVFCIYRRDFHQNFSRIETLGNIYIKIQKSKELAFESSIHYEVNVTHKKSGGSISSWSELIHQNVENYDIISKKISNSINLKKVNDKLETTVKPQTSFRIEMSEKEIKQRDSVSLPYILPGNPGGESKIIYIPDDMDDLDEEDPDDDLDI